MGLGNDWDCRDKFSGTILHRSEAGRCVVPQGAWDARRHCLSSGGAGASAVWEAKGQVC